MGNLATRLTKVEAALEIERQSCLDLRVAHAKPEEVAGFLRAEKADWVEERDRFRAVAQRQFVDRALLQTETVSTCRGRLSLSRRRGRRLADHPSSPNDLAR